MVPFSNTIGSTNQGEYGTTNQKESRKNSCPMRFVVAECMISFSTLDCGWRWSAKRPVSCYIIKVAYINLIAKFSLENECTIIRV